MNPLIPIGILGAAGIALLLGGDKKQPSKAGLPPPPPPVKDDPKIEMIADGIMQHLGGLMSPSQADSKMILTFQRAHNNGPNKSIIYLAENGKYDPLTSAALSLYTKKPIPGDKGAQPRPATVGEALSSVIGEGGSNAGAARASAWNVAMGLERENLDAVNPLQLSQIMTSLVSQFQFDTGVDPRFPGPGFKLSPRLPENEMLAKLATNGQIDRETARALLKAIDVLKYPTIAKWLGSIALPPAPPKPDPTIVNPPAPKPAPLPPIVIPEAPALPVPMPAETRVVVTNDPPPMGDLRVFDKPNGSQIGGVHKLGTVTLLQSNVDGTGFARIRWEGGPARPGLTNWPAVTGFVKEQYLKKPGEVPAPAPGVPATPAPPKPDSRYEGKAIITTKDPSPAGDALIWDPPKTKLVGSASKNGEVAIIKWDTQYPGYANVAWLGDSKYPSRVGYVNQSILKRV